MFQAEDSGQRGADSPLCLRRNGWPRAVFAIPETRPRFTWAALVVESEHSYVPLTQSLLMVAEALALQRPMSRTFASPFDRSVHPLIFPLIFFFEEKNVRVATTTKATEGLPRHPRAREPTILGRIGPKRRRSIRKRPRRLSASTSRQSARKCHQGRAGISRKQTQATSQSLIFLFAFLSHSFFASFARMTILCHSCFISMRPPKR